MSDTETKSKKGGKKANSPAKKQKSPAKSKAKAGKAATKSPGKVGKRGRPKKILTSAQQEKVQKTLSEKEARKAAGVVKRGRPKTKK